jgi:sugar phosphate isomerase/epimerase
MSGSQSSRRAFLKAAKGAGAVIFARQGEAAQQTGTAPGDSTPPPKTARVTSSVLLRTLKGTFEEELAKAARAGMQSTELVSEHLSWSDADVARNKKIAQSYGLAIDAFLAQTDWTKRPVTMFNPEHREAFLKDVRDSIVWAKKLNVPQIIVLSGNEQPGMSREANTRAWRRARSKRLHSRKTRE